MPMNFARRLPRLACAAAMGLIVAMAACASDAGAPPEVADAGPSEAHVPDGPVADGLPGDATAADAPEYDALARDAQDAAPDVRSPGFELGFNPQGANTPSAFTLLADGDTLEIVYGPQGLWMVVLAFRTRGLLAAPLTLDARIRTADAELGALNLVNQPTFDGPEGWAYHYNFFLVVSDPTAAGAEATITFSAADAAGARVDLTHTVRLSGGM